MSEHEYTQRKREIEGALVAANDAYEANPTAENELRFEKLLNAYLRMIENEA